MDPLNNILIMIAAVVVTLLLKEIRNWRESRAWNNGISRITGHPWILGSVTFFGARCYHDDRGNTLWIYGSADGGPKGGGTKRPFCCK